MPTVPLNIKKIPTNVTKNVRNSNIRDYIQVEPK